MKLDRRCAIWLLLILAVWLVVAIVRLIPVGGVWPDLRIDTVLALGGWLVCFVFTYVVSMLSFKQEAEVCVSHRSDKSAVNRWVLRLSALAIVGACLIIYEFAITRGYGFSTPVALIRLTEVQNAQNGFGGSWVSGVGRLLTPSLLSAWVLVLLRWATVRKHAIIFLTFATAAVIWQQFMFEGGRFFLATLLVASALAWRIARGVSKRRAIQAFQCESVAFARPKHRVFMMGTLFVLAILFFSYVFVSRAHENQLSYAAAYQVYASNFLIDVSPDIVERLNGPIGMILFPVMMLWNYITQGFNSLDILVNTPNLDFAYGLFQFPQIGQAFSKLSGISAGYDVFTQQPNPGTYSTIYGASYIDFGHAGTLAFAMVLGSITPYAIRKCAKDDLRGLGLCAPILVTLCLFSPIVSLVTNLWVPLLWTWFVSNSMGSTSLIQRVLLTGQEIYK